MGFVSGFLVIALLVYLLVLIFSIVTYIFKSLGMYTIAKRRGINHPWMAWLPLLSSWLLGCISDQYQYVAKGKQTSRRKVLLWLGIVTMILGFAVGVCYGWIMVDMAVGMETMGEMYVEDTAWIQSSMVPLMIVYASTMITSVVSIVLMVFQYMALYDLFCSCEPNNGVLFLVLSIIFGVAQPFLIFACRNKDNGMQPRQTFIYQPVYQQPPVQPTQPPVWQPPAQPAQPVEPTQPPVQQDAPTDQPE